MSKAHGLPVSIQRLTKSIFIEKGGFVMIASKCVGGGIVKKSSPVFRSVPKHLYPIILIDLTKIPSPAAGSQMFIESLVYCGNRLAFISGSIAEPGVWHSSLRFIVGVLFGSYTKNPEINMMKIIKNKREKTNFSFLKYFSFSLLCDFDLFLLLEMSKSFMPDS